MKYLKFFGDSNCRYKTFDEIVDNLPDEIYELLIQLKTLRERPDYHPEESVYEHIKIVTERLLQTNDPDLVMTGIFHDIGKFVKNIKVDHTTWPTAPDHPKYAADMVDKHRDWIWWYGANPDNVRWLCLNHMKFKGYEKMNKKTPARLDIASSPIYNKLVIFDKADRMLTDFKYNPNESY